VKKILATLASAAFCATALAAGPGEGDADNPNSRGGAYSRAKYDQVLGRLHLTDEQIKKIDAIYAEYDKKMRALYKRNPEDKKVDYAALRKKREELIAERDKKILEVLTEDQQKKYKVAKKIITDYYAKLKELGKEYPKIRKECKGDRQKMMAAYKKLGEKRGELTKDRDRQLDEKVGKMPKLPKLEYRQSGTNRLQGADENGN
jgi:Spy/CpxP family protein refolding chaperone